MLATPLSTSFYDNPAANLAYLESLNVEDTHMYGRGYTQAMHHVLESIVDVKTRFLSVALDSEEEDKNRLIRYVAVLDLFDDAIRGRLQALVDATED